MYYYCAIWYINEYMGLYYLLEHWSRNFFVLLLSDIEISLLHEDIS